MGVALYLARGLSSRRLLIGKLNRSLLILVLGRILVVLSSLAGLRIMTGVLSPDQMGRYAILLAFANGFSLTLVSPVGNYLNRHLLEWDAHGILWPALWRAVHVLAAILIISVCISIALWRAGLLGISVGFGAIIGCVAGFLLVVTINSTLVSALNLIGRPGFYVFYLGLSSWCSVLVPIVCVGIFQHSAEVWVAGQMLGLGIISPFAYRSLRRYTRANSRILASNGLPFSLTALWAFAWPLVLSTALYWFQLQGYRIELEHIVGSAAVGLFITGFILGANPIAAIDTLIGDYFRPRYYRAISGTDRRSQEAAWTAFSGMLSASIIPVGIYIALSGHFLAAVLVSAQYRTVASIVLWGALLETIRALNNVYVLAAHTALYTRALIIPSLVGVALLAGSIIPLARWNLNIGTGAALTTSMFLATISIGWQLRSRFSTRLDYRSLAVSVVFDLPFALGLLVANWEVPHPTPLQALIVLVLGGISAVAVILVVGNKLERHFGGVLPRITQVDGYIPTLMETASS